MANFLGLDDQLPDVLRIPRERTGQVLAILAVFLFIFISLLSAEIFILGPDLRPDGMHGILAPTILDLSARPVVLYDLDGKNEPLGALYLGGNADLYVLYDPCKETVRFVPVGSSRVEHVKRVSCPP